MVQRALEIGCGLLHIAAWMRLLARNISAILIASKETEVGARERARL
jgi:hypothetical protein